MNAPFSKRLQERILYPLFVGRFEKEKMLTMAEMRLAVGEAGDTAEGAYIKVYLLVDENDGIIADCCFQAFGESSLLGSGEAVCELIVRKSYVQASRLHADLVDYHFSSKGEEGSFPARAYPFINLTLMALSSALLQCQDIPVENSSYLTPFEAPGQAFELPPWENFTNEDRLTYLRALIEKDVQPYVALDEGGVEVVEMKNALTVVIRYSGNCLSCFSATGSTLTAIQQIFRSKAHPQILVEPDTTLLTHHHRHRDEEDDE